MTQASGRPKGFFRRDSGTRDPLVVTVRATIVVSSGGWRLKEQESRIKKLVNQLAGDGCLTEFKMDRAGNAAAAGDPDRCAVCGWVHDRSFTQIKLDGSEGISLSGRLPDIVRLVHRAHERNLPGMSTKDEELLKICGGYRHPCKAFDDLKRRREYQLLFDTRRRGFISLRGAVGTSRNQSEAGPECVFRPPA